MSNKKIAAGLKDVLADTFTLYFKTHVYHWNVVGPRFRSLHEMFEEQYTELWEAIDVIAERIRILGEWAPANLNEITQGAKLKESAQLPDANEMVEDLAKDNREIVKNIYVALKVAQEAEDEGTINLLTERIDVHEKVAWMLESSIEK